MQSLFHCQIVLEENQQHFLYKKIDNEYKWQQLENREEKQDNNMKCGDVNKETEFVSLCEGCHQKEQEIQDMIIQVKELSNKNPLAFFCNAIIAEGQSIYTYKKNDQIFKFKWLIKDTNKHQHNCGELIKDDQQQNTGICHSCYTKELEIFELHQQLNN